MNQIEEIISQYGYYAIFSLLALGIVGLPVPDEFLLTFVGYLVSTKVLQFVGAVAVSFCGTMSGMMVSYWLGRKVGKPLIWKYGRWIKLTPARMEKVESWFDKYGPWTIVFGYYIPGIRHLTCYMSGVSGISLRKYLLFASGGALIWCVAFITIGYFIGYHV
ncbi:DedA family protein [Paenibacillus sp. GCM10027626]|uniref:DedA family protein n=1 Tax=Paenibacillus sp. GCM10027626 TaxID=3273411 RepID=UPI003625B4A9